LPSSPLFPYTTLFRSELGVVLAVERMLGMTVPERATWARTLLAELNRVLSHLMFLGVHPLGLGSAPPDLGVAERERLRWVMEERSEEHTSELQSRENL